MGDVFYGYPWEKRVSNGAAVHNSGNCWVFMSKSTDCDSAKTMPYYANLFDVDAEGLGPSCSDKVASSMSCASRKSKSPTRVSSCSADKRSVALPVRMGRARMVGAGYESVASEPFGDRIG